MDTIINIEKIERYAKIKIPSYLKIIILVYLLILGFIIALHTGYKMLQPYKFLFLSVLISGAILIVLLLVYEITQWLKLKSRYSLVARVDKEGNTSYVYKKDAIEDVKCYGGKWRKLTKEEKEKFILKIIKEDTNNYLKASQNTEEKAKLPKDNG